MRQEEESVAVGTRHTSLSQEQSRYVSGAQEGGSIYSRPQAPQTTTQHRQTNKTFSEPATLVKAKTERKRLELIPKLLDTHGLDNLSTW